MQRWLIIISIVFVQESVTLSGLLVKTYQGDYSIWIVTLFFLIATIIDIVVGYFLGKYLKQFLNRGGIHAFAQKWSDRFYNYIGRHGRRVYLLLLGYFSFPYLNSFITAWLGIPFWESFWYLFFGNIFFYITAWLLVLGVTSIIPNPLVAFAVVIGLTVLITIILRLWRSRKI